MSRCAGQGRFLIPLLEREYAITGFNHSPYMLEVCQKKCGDRGLTATISETTFETFSFSEKYNLIFIPSGSFGHLITQAQVDPALTCIVERLNPKGKFVFEIETVRSIHEPQGIWKGQWVTKPDGSKIVLNILSQFDPVSRIDTAIFRYELWEKNATSKIEVEDYQIRYFEPVKIENLLHQDGLKILGKWQAEPHTMTKANDAAAAILYECTKKVG